MAKKTIFIDFDNVIIDTVKAYCGLYSKIYYNHPEFIEPDPEKVWRYDMHDECPLVTDMSEIFNDPRLYQNAPFYDDYTEKVLRALCEDSDIIIATMGTWENVFYKEVWMNQHLPFIKDVIYQRTNRYHGKKALNMRGAIFIDDNFLNLFASNASLKICFGRRGEWNEHWAWAKADNWYGLGRDLHDVTAEMLKRHSI